MEMLIVTILATASPKMSKESGSVYGGAVSSVTESCPWAPADLSITPDQFDFNSPSLSMADFEDEIHRSRVYDPSTKRFLASLIIMMCELALSLTEVVMIVYPPTLAPISCPLEETEYLRSVLRIEECKSGLSRWYDRATVRFPTPAGLTDTHHSVIIFTNLMYIYYQ